MAYRFWRAIKRALRECATGYSHMPKGILIPVFVVAVLLNYLWELAQAPLYVGLESYNSAVLWHCFLASLGDGIIVMIIFTVGWITFHRWDWFHSPGVTGYLVMLAAGLILAVSVEWVAVHRLERWAYAENMPTVPGLGIGLVPIAQMLILPPLVFRTVAFFGSRKR
jgi:hypothetical protein